MRWRLGGAGWASWLWSVEDEELRAAASYAMQPEALGDFMETVRDLLLGCKATFVTLFDEPNGTRVFFNQDGEEVFVQVVSYPTWGSRRTGGRTRSWCGPDGSPARSS